MNKTFREENKVIREVFASVVSWTVARHLRYFIDPRANGKRRRIFKGSFMTPKKCEKVIDILESKGITGWSVWSNDTGDYNDMHVGIKKIV